MKVSLCRRILRNAGELQQHFLKWSVAPCWQRVDGFAIPGGGRRANRCEDIVALSIESLHLGFGGWSDVRSAAGADDDVARCGRVGADAAGSGGGGGLGVGLAGGRAGGGRGAGAGVTTM